jgi:hypothetical protein
MIKMKNRLLTSAGLLALTMLGLFDATPWPMTWAQMVVAALVLALFAVMFQLAMALASMIYV